MKIISKPKSLNEKDAETILLSEFDEEGEDASAVEIIKLITEENYHVSEVKCKKVNQIPSDFEGKIFDY
ncbi:MAG: hypothetical protein ACTSV5_10930 [Promethearchaeota archaeon]